MDRTTRVLTCPQCGAALAPPSRFAREVECAFCASKVIVDPSVVSASRFRDAHRRWMDPTRQGFERWITVGGEHWSPVQPLGRGARADVLLADRARAPSERVVLKVLREPSDRAGLEREQEVLSLLAAPGDPGASHFASLIPRPIQRGTITAGTGEGRSVLVLTSAARFSHTVEAARERLGGRVGLPIVVWIWRRTLETLAFLHRNGIVHGAVLPPHLLAHQREHAIRLVGFGNADRSGAPLRSVDPRFEALYSPRSLATRRLDPAGDVEMSARVALWLAGGEAALAGAPEPLAALLARAASPGATTPDAWALREELGEASRRALGPPSYNPLVLPSEGEVPDGLR